MTQIGPIPRDEFNTRLVEYMQPLYNLALWLCKDGHQASDLVQETLLRAIRARESFREGTNLKAWLFTILRNCFFNVLKRQGKEESLDADVGRSAAVEAEPGAGNTELPPFLMRSDIDRALEKLPDGWRFLILMVDMEGLSLAEAAAVLGVPVGTVKSRLFRARVILSRQLRDYQVPE
ncbi:MAG: RNA polymerase sigma factor [Candidatus Tectomicrobia bacterium]|uniref:RNA polymerase sigma factor n=1 Tax=Tectimicrobiota bacterium TaxID=2528274 RepID=A0A932M255_UNCTE|nr:RNA polymerase sigma factor [Candidatus Tectomicrobia bacterium]